MDSEDELEQTYDAERELDQGGGQQIIPKIIQKHQNFLDIRAQTRVGKKMITVIEGLPSEYDEKKMLKAWKKVLNCNGTVTFDKNDNVVIQLSGDQRNAITKFFVEEGITERKNIKIHGA